MAACPGRASSELALTLPCALTSWAHRCIDALGILATVHSIYWSWIKQQVVCWTEREKAQGGKQEHQRICLQALLRPRKTLFQLSELVDVVKNGAFFPTSLFPSLCNMWFCLRTESKTERMNRVPLHKSAIPLSQIKALTCSLPAYLSTSATWWTGNIWPWDFSQRPRKYLPQS